MDWPRFPHSFAEIADQSLGINGRLFLGPNRGYGRPISGPAPIQISDRLKCAKIGVFLAALRAQKGGRPDWRQIGRDIPRISRETRISHWELAAPSFCGLIAAENSLFPRLIRRLARRRSLRILIAARDTLFLAPFTHTFRIGPRMVKFWPSLAAIRV